jgi:hypothetical protein
MRRRDAFIKGLKQMFGNEEIPQTDVLPSIVEIILQAENLRQPSEFQGMLVNKALDSMDTLTNSHGVEVEYGVRQNTYFCDVKMLYVNVGDQYAMTLIFDVKRNKFFCMSWSDWHEKYGRDGN